MKPRLPLLVLTIGAAFLLASCEGGKTTRSTGVYTGGDVAKGRQLISSKGCGSCHTIPGVNGANGLVGPPLIYFARRTYIAGELPNQPDNLVRWVKSPQSVEPNTAMPNVGLSQEQAVNVAAYLYTLQ